MVNGLPISVLILQWDEISNCDNVNVFSTMLFLSDVAIEDILKVQASFHFFVYLTSHASDTLKVQTDYLTFGNLITTSNQAKLLQWRNIYLNFMQQLL